MESRKIRRLEFVSDKIEGGDSKREVICIRFGHPTKKNEFMLGSSWEVAMAGLEAPLMVAWQARGRDEGGGRRRGQQGARLGSGRAVGGRC
jgi:hypothetical protein